MPRPCAGCSHPERASLDRRLRAGSALVDIVRWLDTTGQPIGRNALSRHARSHVGVTTTPGPRPTSGDFLKDVVSTAHAAMLDGLLAPNIKDAISAQGKLDSREARDADRDVLYRLSIVLSGQAPVPVQLRDPADLATEAEFRALLGDGTDKPIAPPRREVRQGR